MQGFCECGCGEKTKISPASNKKLGYTKGKPRRFLCGHQARNGAQAGISNSRWNGGRVFCSGRPKIMAKDHHRANSSGYVYEHILIAEKALGKSLPPKAVVHHADATKNGGQLVICQDTAYHMLLHRRMRAHKACGHASWRKCCFCKEFDDPLNMTITAQNGAYHRKCHSKYESNRCKK